MQKIYINTTTRQWFDTNGALFGSGSPQLAYKRTEEIALQLCSETPDDGTDGVNPETDWTKDTSFGVGGIGAKLSIDNDFLRRRKGTLSAAIPAGAVSTVTAAIEGASKATIRTNGILKVFDADGNAEALECESASFSGNSVTFTLKNGSEVENSYTQGAEMDVPDALYAQAMMDSEKSDAAAGLFVFNIVVYSEKLRAVMEYANIANLDTLAGMELLLFKTSGDTITELNNFLCTTVSLHATMAEANTLAQVPPSMTDELVSLITSTLGNVEYEYSEDGTNWHSTRTDADNYFRFKLTGSGSSGTWITANMINGTTPHIGENGNWYIGDTDTGVSAEGEDGDTPYINPETWHWIIGETDTGIKAKGEDGATWYSGSSSPVSATGNDGDWYVDTSTTDVYRKASGSWVLQFRLSVLNPSGEWSASVAYPMNALVSYDGSMYIAAENTAAGDTPGVSAKWMLYVSKGATGTTPHIASTTKHWMIGDQDTGIVAEGFSPYIGTNGNWVDANGDTGVKAELSGSYLTFSSVSSNQVTFAGTETVPVGVLTNAGHYYPVEKGSLTVDTVNDTFTFDVTPYLAYDNVASFSGTWTLFMGAGSSEEITFNGMPYVALTSAAAVTIPAGGKAYTLTVDQNMTVTFPVAGNTSCYFWLYLTNGATVYSITLPNVQWEYGTGPDLSSADSLYRLAFLWDVPKQKWLGSKFWPAEALS